MTIILIMLATALAVAIVFLIGKTSQVARLETENTILRRDSERLQHDLKENDEIWQKRLEKSHNDEIEQRRQFELMASQALLDGSHTMTEHQNHRLEQLLTPLRNELETFRKRVDEVYNHESREIFSLKDQIEQIGRAHV